MSDNKNILLPSYLLDDPIVVRKGDLIQPIGDGKKPKKKKKKGNKDNLIEKIDERNSYWAKIC